MNQAQSDWTMGQAAIAIGASPSDFMSPRVSSNGGGGGGSAPTDPRLPVYQGVHEVLVAVARTRGGPDPQIAPAFAARALDVLEDRMSTTDAVRLWADSLPPLRATMLKLASKVPFLGSVDRPAGASRGGERGALADLHRLFPDALLAGQPPPAAGVASAPAVSAPGHGFDTPLVDVLLSRAMATDAEHADAIYVVRSEAAEQTPGIEDDLAVLHQLVRAGGAQPPSEAVTRRAASVIGGLASRTERRDDVAQLLAWVVYAAIARGLVGELGARLLKSCQSVLGAAGLGQAAAVQLTTATVGLFIHTREVDRANRLLDVMQKRVTEPALRQALAEVRTTIKSS